MLTLVQIQASATSAEDATTLVSDYLEFDRLRTNRRQYGKAFGGIAILVLIAAVFGRVPADEAWIVAGLLVAPPLIMAVVEGIQRHRLMKRLDASRAKVQSARKS